MSTIESSFPNLKQSGYVITSPRTSKYNCISWAAGDDRRKWWPDNQNLGYWPVDAPRTETLASFKIAYSLLGYTECDNGDCEPGFEKIAIYVNVQGKPTHAARQLASGMWTSKVGHLEDIEHTLDGLVSQVYGSVAVFMKRSRLLLLHRKW